MYKQYVYDTPPSKLVYHKSSKAENKSNVWRNLGPPQRVDHRTWPWLTVYTVPLFLFADNFLQSTLLYQFIYLRPCLAPARGALGGTAEGTMEGPAPLGRREAPLVCRAARARLRAVLSTACDSRLRSGRTTWLTASNTSRLVPARSRLPLTNVGSCMLASFLLLPGLPGGSDCPSSASSSARPPASCSACHAFRTCKWQKHFVTVQPVAQGKRVC